MKQYFLLWMLLLALLGVRGQDGSFDETFNGVGWTKLYFAKSGNISSESTEGMVVQPDGKYIVLLRSRPSGLGPTLQQEEGGSFFLARYNADGTLDNNFGTGGFSQPLNFTARSVAVQPLSGGTFALVVAGYASSATEEAILTLTRYTSDGALDGSFGTAGRVQVDFTPYSPYSGRAALAIHSDGTIVAVSSGTIYPPEIPDGAAIAITETQYAMLVVRFMVDGSPDATLGAGGKVIVPFGSTDVMADAVAIEPDKDIVVAGRTATNEVSYYSFILARIDGAGDSIGKLDATFGSDGITITDFGANAYTQALAIQSGGTIVAAGVAEDATEYTDEFALARYTANGILIDTATTDMGGNEQVGAMALDNEDRIVLAGRSYWYGMEEPIFNSALARYTAAGVLDETFNPSGDLPGTVVTSVSTGDEGFRAVAVLGSGSIIAAGGAVNTANLTQNEDLFFARYTSGGVLDDAFNSTGIVFGYYAWDAEANITAMAVQPDGKVVVAGESQAYSATAGAYRIMAVARYNANGTLDASFGTGGVAIADFGFETSVSSVVIQYDQKIVIGGGTSYYDGLPHYDFALARFTSAGQLDASFDGDGRVTTDFNSHFDYITGLAIQGDGKIVAVGTSEIEAENQYPDFFVVRYNTNGSLDNLFGPATADFYGYRDMAEGVVIQKDGKIVVSGSANHPDPNNPWEDKYDFAVARFTSTGQLDRMFSGDGKATVDLGYTDYGGAPALQPDGKIVVGGTVLSYSDGGGISVQSEMADFGVVRFTTTGQLDRSFSGDGKATVDIAGLPDVGGRALLQSDGKIVLAGWYGEEPIEGPMLMYAALARLTASGELDTSFDTDGKAAQLLSGPVMMRESSATWYGGRVYISGQLHPFNELDAGLLLALEASTTTQAPTIPVVSINDQSVDKTQGSATLTITVTGTVTTPFTVNYATQDVTAVSKGKAPDYGTTKGTVTFSPESASPFTVTIPIYNTTATTGYPKVFNVSLTLDRRTPNAATFSKSTGVVNITLPGAVTQAAPAPPETAQSPLAVTIFPNPTTGYFTLQLQGGNDTPVTVQVTDNTGRVIETKAAAARSTLHLGSNYRPGVYYLHLQQGAESQTLKLVKQAP